MLERVCRSSGPEAERQLARGEELGESRCQVVGGVRSYMCVDSGRVVWSCSSGPSACRKESTDLLLRRKGARRRKLPGEQGICTRALWEGTTVSPGDSQGGTLERMLRSSSGENTGLSIPRRKGSGWSDSQVSLGQQGGRVRPWGSDTSSSRSRHLEGHLGGLWGSMFCTLFCLSIRSRQGT